MATVASKECDPGAGSRQGLWQEPWGNRAGFLDPRGQEDPLETGDGCPLQYSCLENPGDKGTWRATAHGVAKSRPRHTHTSVSVPQGAQGRSWTQADRAGICFCFVGEIGIRSLIFRSFHKFCSSSSMGPRAQHMWVLRQSGSRFRELYLYFCG